MVALGFAIYSQSFGAGVLLTLVLQINVQITCDHKGYFRDISAKCPASKNDIEVFRASTIYKERLHRLLPGEALLADKGK